MEQKNNEADNSIKEVLPKDGLLHSEENPSLILCKPKLMPLKTLTLQRLEEMQREAEIRAKEDHENIED